MLMPPAVMPPAESGSFDEGQACTASAAAAADVVPEAKPGWAGPRGERKVSSLLAEVFGLSPAEEGVYLTLLDMPPVTLADACRACGMVNRNELRAIMETLTDKGLLTEVSQQPCRYTPTSPERALDAHLSQREEELRRARTDVAGLTERYRAIPRHDAAGELTEIVTGTRRTMRRWYDSLASAGAQVRVFNRPPFENQSPGPHPAQIEVLGKGVAVRSIYDDSGMASPAAVARRRAELAAGEQVRVVTGEMPVHLLLIDDRLALMSVSRQWPPTDDLLIVHPCGLLDALGALFEMVWGSALPLSPDASPCSGGPQHVLGDDTTRTVLSLLAAGLSDQAIARRLDRSERTVQRHVLKLVDAVGAKTRFQAALHIGHRHWAAPAGQQHAGK